MLGLNTLEITCEGVAIICANSSKADEMLKRIRKTKHGKNAQIVGTVRAEKQGYVFLKTMIGGTRIIDMPMGEPIPRVC
jgi:hydrogenase expression/formation protein HypE